MTVNVINRSARVTFGGDSAVDFPLEGGDEWIWRRVDFPLAFCFLNTLFLVVTPATHFRYPPRSPERPLRQYPAHPPRWTKGRPPSKTQWPFESNWDGYS